MKSEKNELSKVHIFQNVFKTVEKFMGVLGGGGGGRLT